MILKELLPGVDLGDIISKQPRLLTMEEAREKVRSCLSTVSLSPLMLISTSDTNAHLVVHTDW